MAIKPGDRLPAGTLYEFNETEGAGCPVGPQAVDVAAALKGKRVVIFGLPGAFTPTCSGKHLPGYVAHAAALRAKGVDEIWCLSVNDAFVMGAWAREQQTAGRVRLLADGNADYARALDLALDLTGRGMGVRSQRYSMLVEDGVLQRLNLEQPGKFEVSGAEQMLEQL